MSEAYTMVAAGNIAPSRFVKLSTTANGRVAQCGSAEQIYGISQPGTRNTPYSSLDDGYAAIAGENLLVYGAPGARCLLELGGTVTRGDRLKSDTNGKGTTATTEEYGAVALASGVSGQLIEVQIEKGRVE